MTTRLSIVSIAVISVTLALASGSNPSGFGSVAFAGQGSANQQTAQPQHPDMQAMMKMHEQMMADMTAADAKLDALVKSMNSATGDAKANAMAAVVNELVQQHKAMHSHMGQMHLQMMGGRGGMMRR